MSTASLEITNATKRFGSVTAVDGLNLCVSKGAVHAVLGPSGCGKTTLLRLLSGFERPEIGTVRISKETVSGPGVFLPPERRRIGMVFQDYALFPHLNVQRNVAFGLPRFGGGRERVAEVLKMVDLSGLGSRMPHELSGGQQQRVALARALAPAPDVLLLDEPFSNLDAHLRVQVRGGIRRILHDAGTTTLFVTHDQEEALSLADEISVMREGRIQQTASPQELYRCPASRTVAEFIGDSNFIPGEAVGQKVRCALGELTLRTPVEGPVDVLVRPEDIELHSSGAVPVTTVASEFFGHDQFVMVKLESGSVLKVRLPASHRYPLQHRLTARVRVPVQVFSRSV